MGSGLQCQQLAQELDEQVLIRRLRAAGLSEVVNELLERCGSGLGHA